VASGLSVQSDGAALQSARPQLEPEPALVGALSELWSELWSGARALQRGAGTQQDTESALIDQEQQQQQPQFAWWLGPPAGASWYRLAFGAGSGERACAGSGRSHSRRAYAQGRQQPRRRCKDSDLNSRACTWLFGAITPQAPESRQQQRASWRGGVACTTRSPLAVPRSVPVETIDVESESDWTDSEA